MGYCSRVERRWFNVEDSVPRIKVELYENAIYQIILQVYTTLKYHVFNRLCYIYVIGFNMHIKALEVSSCKAIFVDNMVAVYCRPMQFQRTWRELKTRRDETLWSCWEATFNLEGASREKKVLGICNLVDNILGMPLKKVCHGISSRCLGS